VEEFARYAGIPTINALTDEEHPCQILADILTIQEKLGGIAGKVVTFVGDGACNVANSWIFAAAKFGFELRIAAPKKFQPSAALLKRAGGKIVSPRPEGRSVWRRCLHRRLGFNGQEAESLWRVRRDGLPDQSP
jgi:ornithine carbamoyltransferase